MKITNQKNITTALTSDGFVRISNTEMTILDSAVKSSIEFQNFWNFLEIDPYLEAKGHSYRERRYGSYILNSDTMSFTPNAHQNFIQSSELNSLFGNVERKFAPLTEQMLNNEFLKELIKADFDILPEDAKSNISQWEIGLHFFRIKATNDFIGDATPEGIHQDGHSFVCQHMINKKNVSGGESSIYDLDKNLIVSTTLENFMDSIIVVDSMVMHGVSKILLGNKGKIGYRDMLIIDINPIL